ncbi:nitroreductase [Sphingomonas parva]|uniref:Putative NAD(P)H nitroreductase n=1 Tax=Sphingomonas parva TaxID=2555898 RepID=A0A4Y8ZPR6_9SPHN|nr:nitroreductase [Sphingomonas parva]TFI56829.1 nitroreductase [Sphingomonas parva]
MFNDTSSPLSLLRTRRSARPRDLVEPGPDATQLRQILEIAMRTPDHGKLHPWRFVHVPKAQRGAFASLLARAYAAQRPDAGRLEIEANERFAHQAPELIAMLSTPVESQKIPRWEQELSAGAAMMNLLHAAHALGFAGGWVTGWVSESKLVLEALGGRDGDRIVGFVFVGTPGVPLEERPRPDFDEVVSTWRP